MIDMLICHLQLKMKSKTDCFFLIYGLLVKIKGLLHLCTGNKPLGQFIHILRVFLQSAYICLVLSRYLHIDPSGYDRV